MRYFICLLIFFPVAALSSPPLEGNTRHGFYVRLFEVPADWTNPVGEPAGEFSLSSNPFTLTEHIAYGYKNKEVGYQLSADFSLETDGRHTFMVAFQLPPFVNGPQRAGKSYLQCGVNLAVDDAQIIDQETFKIVEQTACPTMKPLLGSIELKKGHHRLVLWLACRGQRAPQHNNRLYRYPRECDVQGKYNTGPSFLSDVPISLHIKAHANDTPLLLSANQIEHIPSSKMINIERKLVNEQEQKLIAAKKAREKAKIDAAKQKQLNAVKVAKEKELAVKEKAIINEQLAALAKEKEESAAAAKSRLQHARYAPDVPDTQKPINTTLRDRATAVKSTPRTARRAQQAPQSLCPRPEMWRTTRDTDVFQRPSARAQKTVQIFRDVHVEVTWCDREWLRVVSKRGEHGYMRKSDAIPTRESISRR